MFRLPSLAVPLLATSLILAQADVARTAFGVREEQGIVRAMGPDFGVSFTAGGIEFTPVLGARAVEPASLRYTWTDVRRGAVEVARREIEVAPVIAGNRVSYRRNDSLREVYDVRQEGVEQSFVFATRPAGDGDLVVRGEIATALPLAFANDLGARFTLPSGVGVSIGAVTGVDANGATVSGSLRLIGSTLELSLPDAFVDAAAYPLVLDPLLGTVNPIVDVVGEADRNPSVAFDEASGRFLVVWNVQYAASSWEVRGKLTNGAGLPLSTPPMTISAIGTSTTVDRSSVANVRGAGRFVVAMRGVGAVSSLHARSISASLATMGPITNLVTSATQNVRQAAIGGDSRAAGLLAMVAFTSMNLSNGYTYCFTTLLSVDAAGAITTVLANNERTNSFVPNIEIAIASHGGVLGRWLTAWTATTGSGALRIVNAQQVGSAGTACSPVINVEYTNSGAETASEIACATRDGTLGMVSWTYSYGTTRSVRARVLVAVGPCGSMTSNTGAIVSLPAGTGLRDRSAVDFAADKFVLAFRERQAVGGQARVVTLGLDLNSGQPAGAEHYPSGWLPVDADPAVAAKWSSGATTDDALLVWSDDAAIAGRRFEATGGGTVTAMGVGCGYSSFAGDFHTYSGLPTLGQTFSIELASPTFPTLALIVGFTHVPFACGPCTVVPSADLLLSPVNPTVLAVPNAPSLIGAELFTQWLQLRPSGCPILPDFGFTNALKFTIAE